MNKKIITREEAAKICEEYKAKGKTVGYTSGAFDLMHAGHVDYLTQAREKCDVLILGLNSDDSIKAYKDVNRPINAWEHRAKVLSALNMIDYIFKFEEKNNNLNIEVIKPSLYIKAGDYDINQLSSKPIVEKHGGKAMLIPVKEVTSTTDIIKKIKSLPEKVKPEHLELNNKEKIKMIFLDRDGTINVDKSYLYEKEKWEFTPNAIFGMKKMNDLGFKLAIATNQPGIALGYYTKEDFYKLIGHMFKLIAPEGISIDKVYFCPHGFNDGCSCRKPGTGMVDMAKEFYGDRLDVENSYFIGDKTSDIKCGKDSGLRTILVDQGWAGKDGRHPELKPDFVAKDLLEAATFIEKNSN
jgi:rfaE bifunctional protein nucleotidyltransferase chain/domain